MRNAQECVYTSTAALIVGALAVTTLVVTSTNASATPAHHAPPALTRATPARTAVPDAHLPTTVTAPPALVKVAAGDTLTALSATHLGDPGRWTDLWNANRGVVGGNPNLIYPGQALTLPSGHVPPHVELVAAPVHAAPVRPAVSQNTAPRAPRRAAAPVPAVSSNGPAIYRGIAWCESGDNPRAQNRHSTASGLFQELDSTWAGYGGYARAMYAPVAVQEAKAFSQSLSNWLPYEPVGCAARNENHPLP